MELLGLKLSDIFKKKPEIVNNGSRLDINKGDEVLLGSDPATADYRDADLSPKARFVRINLPATGNVLSRAIVRIELDKDSKLNLRAQRCENLVWMWWQDRKQGNKWVRYPLTPGLPVAANNEKFSDHITIDIESSDGQLVRLTDAGSSGQGSDMAQKSFRVDINPKKRDLNE